MKTLVDFKREIGHVDAEKDAAKYSALPALAAMHQHEFHRGQALVHESDYQGAIEAFEDALVVNPPNVPPALLQLELGRAYYKLGFERRSREALTKVTTLDKGGAYAAAAKELLARLKP